MKNKATKSQIKKDVAYNYNEHGQAAAFDTANFYGVKYEYCKACETDSPAIDHECLICGQTIASQPTEPLIEGILTGGGHMVKLQRRQ